MLTVGMLNPVHDLLIAFGRVGVAREITIRSLGRGKTSKERVQQARLELVIAP